MPEIPDKTPLITISMKIDGTIIGELTCPRGCTPDPEAYMSLIGDIAMFIAEAFNTTTQKVMEEGHKRLKNMTGDALTLFRDTQVLGEKRKEDNN